MMPILAVFTAVVAITALTIYGPKGYESQANRQQKAPGAIKAAGLPEWIERVQAAQNNTWEAAITTVCTFFVATSLEVPTVLLAKIATLLLLIRLAYPLAYAFDLDFLRTQLWFTGLHCCVLAAFGGLFPDTILPMLGS